MPRHRLTAIHPQILEFKKSVVRSELRATLLGYWNTKAPPQQQQPEAQIRLALEHEHPLWLGCGKNPQTIVLLCE